jgi:hypothetical protein
VGLQGVAPWQARRQRWCAAGALPTAAAVRSLLDICAAGTALARLPIISLVLQPDPRSWRLSPNLKLTLHLCAGAQYSQHAAAVTAVCLLPAHTQLAATRDAAGAAHLWSTASGGQAACFPGPGLAPVTGKHTHDDLP